MKFQQMIMEAIVEVSLHPDSCHSDTIVITKHLEQHHEKELSQIGIELDYVTAAGGEYNPVLTQLNNLHEKGILIKHKTWNPPNRYIIRWRRRFGVRLCFACGKKWSDFELMTKGGIKVGKDGDIEKLVCPNCGADLGHF